jgi:hypothetical protein
MAVLIALFTTVLLMGLGLSIVLVGTSEATLAADDRAARALREAAMAAVHVAVADLRGRPWSALLAAGSVAPFSAAPGRLVGASVTPPAPWGGSPLDLLALTADVQASADTGAGDPQAWRLFVCGALDELVPGAAGGPWYLGAWIADDLADADGDPSVDANGILSLRAVAFGPRGAMRATAVTVRKTVVAGEPEQVTILTIRPAS